MQVDSFAPAHSAFGFPIYVAPLPAGSIQRVCHDTLDFIQVPDFHSAIETRSLPSLAPTFVVLPSMSLGPPLHSLRSRTPAVLLFNASRGLPLSRLTHPFAHEIRRT